MVERAAGTMTYWMPVGTATEAGGETTGGPFTGGPLGSVEGSAKAVGGGRLLPVAAVLLGS